MLFNSIEFLIIFLPVILFVYHTVPVRARLLVLCIGSLYFYGRADWVPLLFLVLSVIWAYGLGILSVRFHRGLVVGLAVTFPLLVLFLFRYLDFALTNIGAGDSTRDVFYFFLSVSLPAGISFYSFQVAAYSIDVYDGVDPPERNFIKLLAFVSFFPQLIAGPIMRYDQMSGQLDHVNAHRSLDVDWAKAFKFVSFGLFGKVVVADVCAGMVTRFDLATGTSSLDAFLSVLSYSFQIYFDFWAYSVIAIGLGEMFGLRLVKNFNEPYRALNMRDFWRRWHLTLSSWLRDYFYIRIGGNRRYYRNILLVFAAVGLWHGAGWNFIIWGLYHGFWVLVYATGKAYWDRLPGWLAIALTFLIVTLGWPLFYLDIGPYSDVIITIFSFSDLSLHFYDFRHILLLGIFSAWVFMARESNWLYNHRLAGILDSPVLHAGMVFVAMMFVNWSKTFIYFRF